MGLPRPTTDGNLLAGVTQLVDALDRSGIGAISQFAFGTSVLSWPGGSIFSNGATVALSFRTTPVAILATPVGGGGQVGLNTYPLGATYNYATTGFTLQASTIDGQNPLNTAQSQFAWLALA